jgi:hypothetical protein
MIRRSHWTLLLGAALFTSGCASDYWVALTTISDAPPSVQVNRSRIEIPAGLAVGVRAEAMEDDERTGQQVDFVPVRAGIIGIEQALENDEWVIYGVSPGNTDVEVWFDDELVAEMPAVITEQHPPKP